MSDPVFPWGDPDAAIARVNAQVAEAQERAVKADQVRVEIDALRERVYSPRREVAAEVDASGRLTGLDLTDDATALRPDALARLILETAAKAQVAAGRRAVDVAAAAFGDDSAAVDHLRAEVAARAPEAPGGSGIGYR